MAAVIKLRTSSSKRSPALNAFEFNPFRVLRIPVNVPTSDAATQAENALTLERVGLSLDDPDPLPWLPAVGSYELQQAAQAVEEPLVRLKHQMLWFDCVRDTNAALLREALADPRDAAGQEYLSEDVELPPMDAAAEGGVNFTDLASQSTAHSLVARVINQANLRLLLGAATLDAALAGPLDVQPEARKIGKDQWKLLKTMRSLPDAHAVLTGNVHVAAAITDGKSYWASALKRWEQTLAHPWFRSYVAACIADLGDDFVSSEDVETVQESVRAHLIDLSSQQARVLLLEGRYSLAGALIAAIADSGMDIRVITPATRPLRRVFQGEITELESLLEQPQGLSLEAIDAYLKRLESVKSRWMQLDAQGIVGLRDVLDDAVEKCYLKLRTLEKPAQSVDGLLSRAGRIASAQSLKERLTSFQAEVVEARARVCQFCKDQDPDYEKSVVLTGKKETKREYNFGSTTVHYALRYKLMLRCARCARLHDYEERLVHLLVGVSLAFVAIMIFGEISFDELVGVAIYLAVFTGLGVVFGLNWLFRILVGSIVTPSNHRRIGKFRDTEGATELKGDGYSVRAAWSSNAVSKIKKA